MKSVTAGTEPGHLTEVAKMIKMYNRMTVLCCSILNKQQCQRVTRLRRNTVTNISLKVISAKARQSCRLDSYYLESKLFEFHANYLRNITVRSLHFDCMFIQVLDSVRKLYLKAVYDL